MARGQVDKSNPPLGVYRLPVWSSAYSPTHQPTTAQLYPGLGTLTAVSPQLHPCRGQLMHCLWCLPSSPPSRVPCSEFAFQRWHSFCPHSLTTYLHLPDSCSYSLPRLHLSSCSPASSPAITEYNPMSPLFFSFLILQITPTWQQKSQQLLHLLWTPYPNSQL